MQPHAHTYSWHRTGHSADALVSLGRGGNLEPYLDPRAWYVLTNTDGFTDKTANGHNLSGSLGNFIRGKNLGMVCSYNVGLLEPGLSPVWRTAGALSCVSMVDINNSAGDRWFASCERSGGYKTWWKFGVGNNGKACYGVNDGNGSQFYQWGPTLPTTGWHTFGWSRTADGHTVKVYVDGVLMGTGYASMNSAGGNDSQLSIGKDYFQPVQPYRQQLNALWLRELSAIEHKRLSDRIQGTD